METFNNHLCYVILFENHQHGGTHGMTNRLRGYTRQKRLGNTAVGDREPMQRCEGGGDMMVCPYSHQDPGSTVLNVLELVDALVWNPDEEGIAVV